MFYERLVIFTSAFLISGIRILENATLTSIISDVAFIKKKTRGQLLEKNVISKQFI